MKVTIDTTGMRYCRKCKRSNLIIDRHHMGYDSYVGRFVSKIRRNYLKFEGCCDLCKSCHMRVHWLYYPYVQIWWRVHRFKSTKELIVAATKLHADLTELCTQWLNNKINAPPMPTTWSDHWGKMADSSDESNPGQRGYQPRGSSRTKGKPATG